MPEKWKFLYETPSIGEQYQLPAISCELLPIHSWLVMQETTVAKIAITTLRKPIAKLLSCSFGHFEVLRFLKCTV